MRRRRRAADRTSLPPRLAAGVVVDYTSIRNAVTPSLTILLLPPLAAHLLLFYRDLHVCAAFTPLSPGLSACYRLLPPTAFDATPHLPCGFRRTWTRSARAARCSCKAAPGLRGLPRACSCCLSPTYNALRDTTRWRLNIRRGCWPAFLLPTTARLTSAHLPTLPTLPDAASLHATHATFTAWLRLFFSHLHSTATPPCRAACCCTTAAHAALVLPGLPLCLLFATG